MAAARRRATIATIVVTSILVLAIYFGSGQLRHFDSALIGYAIASVFAVAMLTYRYTLWISRPATWRYWVAGWKAFLSWENFKRYALLVPKAWWTDLLAQTFIRQRSTARWIMHLCIFWGVALSIAVTFPLSFGWIHFSLVPPDDYTAWFWGIPTITFPIEARQGFAIYHVLDFTAILLLIGLVIAVWRRLTVAGLLTTQRFGFDMLPLVLLLAIAVTGLALTASSMWFEGRFYWFISLVHQVVVILWLLMLPFGKFFHIIERPASIGVTLHQTVSQEQAGPGQPEEARCKRCGAPLPSKQFVSDLKAVLGELGQNYQFEDNDEVWLQDHCPQCKRVLRGQAYYEVMENRFL